MQDLLKRAYEEGIKYTDEANVADYIPELAKEDKTKAGVVVIDKDGNVFSEGEVEKTFSIQSIVKVVAYLVALENIDKVRIDEAIGVKPTALPFNSVLDVELGGGKPRNPYVNAGAMAVTGLLYEKFGDDALDMVVDKVRDLADRDSINISQEIYESERDTAFNNRAIFHMMVARGIFKEDLPVDKVANMYFRNCSILVSAKDLGRISSVIANDGLDVVSGTRKFDEKHGKTLRTIMALCGMYDNSGEFALSVGLPAKSGVGGGIIATSPEGIGIATYCPGLDEAGNSLVGQKILEVITKELDLSIY